MWQLKLYRGKYYAYSKVDGDSVRRSLRTSDEPVAKRRFEDFLKQQLTPSNTVEEIFNVYRAEKENEHGSLGYLWIPLQFFKDYTPEQITRDKCKQYVQKRRDKDKVGDWTIIREIGALRAAMRFHDKETPARFYIPPAPAYKERYLTKQEFKKLMAGSVEPHIKLFIIMGLCTAARKSAILQLKWEQVDFKRGIINFGNSNKYKGKAQVPINTTLGKALKEYYEARTCEYVIEYGSKPIKDVKRGFTAAVKRAGLEDVTPHVLRHTAAVWMAENRVPMSEISQYLGHKNTAITEKVYARYSPEYLRSAAESLEIF